MLLFSEVLCQEALQATIGDNLLWSSSRDTQEGVKGKSFTQFAFYFFIRCLAVELLNATKFPYLCIVAHHGSQQTIQFQYDRYTGIALRDS